MLDDDLSMLDVKDVASGVASFMALIEVAIDVSARPELRKPGDSFYVTIASVKRYRARR